MVGPQPLTLMADPLTAIVEREAPSPTNFFDPAAGQSLLSRYSNARMAREPAEDLARSAGRLTQGRLQARDVAAEDRRLERERLLMDREDAEFDSRPCFRCVVTYDTAEFSPDYRKSEILIDKQLSMPVSVRNYTWAQDADPATIDDETLIEHYMYSDIQMQQQFADLDFSRTNEDYRMVR